MANTACCVKRTGTYMFMIAGLFIMPARSGMPAPMPGKPGMPPPGAPPAFAPAPARGETDPSAASPLEVDAAAGARERAVASEDFMVAFCSGGTSRVSRHFGGEAAPVPQATHRRVELETLLVRLDCLCKLSDGEEGVAEARVGLAERCVDVDRLAGVRHGRLVLPNLRVRGGSNGGNKAEGCQPGSRMYAAGQRAHRLLQ